MLRSCIYGEALSMTWLIVYSWLEHAQVMYIWRGPFNEVTDGLLEVGTCSGHVYMERPFQ